MTTAHAVLFKARLKAGLKHAMIGKRAAEVSLLRGLIAAIDNAEAPPLAPEGRQGMGGPSEIDRLQLGQAEIAAVVQGEIAALEQAAAEMLALGQADRAEVLIAQAAFARQFLG